MNDVLDLDRVSALAVERGPDRATWIAIGVAAGGTDLAVRSGVTGLAGAALVSAVAAALVLSGRLVNPAARVLALAAPVFAMALAMRTSPWLVGPDVVAAAALLVLACSLARRGDPLDLTLPSLVTRGVVATTHGLAAPGFLLLGIVAHRSRATMALRGLLLAAPVALVLGVLLGSADPVFASLFRLPGDPVEFVVHAVLLGVGAWGMAGLVRLASAATTPAPPTLPWRLGRVEATTVLGALVALYGAFAAAQVVAAAGGAERVLSAAGVSYADYARSGFFQLLAVAGLTLCVLMAVRAAAGGSLDGRLLVLSQAAVGLTVVIVAVALRRLWLYDQAFGLTMLRLYAVVFAVWVGLVFVLLGASLSGAGRARAWLVPAALGTALVLLLALNVANPEAVVVRRNLALAEAGGQFDGPYLAALSDDAVPTLVAGLDRLAPQARAELVLTLCAEATGHGDSQSGGFWAFNRARDRAVAARNRLCRE